MCAHSPKDCGRNSMLFFFFLLSLLCHLFRAVSRCHICPSIIYRLSYRCDKSFFSLLYSIVEYTHWCCWHSSQQPQKIVLLRFDSAKLHSIVRIEKLDEMECSHHYIYSKSAAVVPLHSLFSTLSSVPTCSSWFLCKL